MPALNGTWSKNGLRSWLWHKSCHWAIWPVRPRVLKVSMEGKGPCRVWGKPSGKVTVQSSGVLERRHTTCSRGSYIFWKTSPDVLWSLGRKKLPNHRHQVTTWPDCQWWAGAFQALQVISLSRPSNNPLYDGSGYLGIPRPIRLGPEGQASCISREPSPQWHPLLSHLHLFLSSWVRP